MAAELRGVWEAVVALLWPWLLCLGRRMWPIEAHHRWTPTTATILLRQPPGAPAASLRMLQITDAHISEDPLLPWELRHAKRMHGAFREASVANGSAVKPASVLRELLDLAGPAAEDADLLVVSGDVVNFPQEETAAWVAGLLSETAPFVYTAGNHDWFYEGMAGTQSELQRHWRSTALRPLYELSAPRVAAPGTPREGEGAPYDFDAYEAGGVLVLTVDNSRQQLTYEQLDFLRGQLLRWLPTVLVLHVPLSVDESLRPFHGYALCGDPAWGESTDRSWRDERRAPWPRSGNSRATELFLDTVLSAAAPAGPLIAVLAGHVHHHDATPFGAEAAPAEGGGAVGAVQYVGLPAFNGGHRVLELRSVAAGHDADLGAELERLVRQEAFLGGLAGALLAGPSSRCFGGARGAAAAAAAVDIGALGAALQAARRRTAAALRGALAALAGALRVLLSPGRGACADLRALLSAALPEWADPRALAYAPGRRLDLRPGCSVLRPIAAAVGASVEGDWSLVGDAVGAAVRATAGCVGGPS